MDSSDCEILGRLAQLVRAPARQAGGRRFEPSIAHCKQPVDSNCQRVVSFDGISTYGNGFERTRGFLTSLAILSMIDCDMHALPEIGANFGANGRDQACSRSFENGDARLGKYKGRLDYDRLWSIQAVRGAAGHHDARHGRVRNVPADQAWPAGQPNEQDSTRPACFGRTRVQGGFPWGRSSSI